MVRCYDCGQPIRDDQIVRRFVKTGGSSGRRSNRFYYHKVNLCPVCAASRAKTNRIFLLVALAIGGSMLMSCLCCGLLGVFIPKKEKQTKDVNTSRLTASVPEKTEAERGWPDVNTSRLTATVTWTGPPGTRRIGLQQGGIPRFLPAGDYTFNLAPDAPLPNVRVGQKVECVMERRNGQWVVKQISPNKLVAIPDNKPLLPGNKSLVPDNKKTSDVIHIDSFLGISPDFEAYAMRAANGVRVVDLGTGENLISLKWDRDWGGPLSSAFGDDTIAVMTTGRKLDGAVKIFSRKTGELVQNIHGREVKEMAFTVDGRFLAITEFRTGQGFHLVLRDIQGKKTIAESNLGGNGYCSLAVAGMFAAGQETEVNRITVVEADTGRLVKEFVSLPLIVSWFSVIWKMAPFELAGLG
jgi:hypothetical protein